MPSLLSTRGLAPVAWQVHLSPRMSVQNLNAGTSTEERRQKFAALVAEGILSAQEAEETISRVPAPVVLEHGRRLMQRDQAEAAGGALFLEESR